MDLRADSLTIYDGGSNTSPIVGDPYCGDSLPPNQISSSNRVFIHFHSNHFGTATGFKLEYNATSKNHCTLFRSEYEWPKDKADSRLTTMAVSEFKLEHKCKI